MTREEAVTYLDKLAEARKVLISVPNPEIGRYDNETFPCNMEKEVHMYETRVLTDALGFPAVFKRRDSDNLPWEMYFYWKGIRFFSIHSDKEMHNRKGGVR